jgi:predicted metal-binding membrane protein
MKLVSTRLPLQPVRPTLSLLAVVLVAWLALLLWSQSAYQPYLGHDVLADMAPRQAWLLLVVLAGWTLMVVAMMLPASLPILSRLSGGRGMGVPPFVGYLAVWAAFGLLLLIADALLHRAAVTSAAFAAQSWLLAPAALVLAGAYQLTPLKQRYLAQVGWCPQVATSLRAGLAHGRACVGCSGPLMLVMVAVGHGSLLVMAFLGGIMAAEKLTSWGREMASSLGVALLGAGCALVVLERLG